MYKKKGHDDSGAYDSKERKKERVMQEGKSRFIQSFLLIPFHSIPIPHSSFLVIINSLTPDSVTMMNTSSPSHTRVLSLPEHQLDSI